MFKKIIAIAFMSTTFTQSSEILIKSWTESSWTLEKTILKVQQTMCEQVVCVGGTYKVNRFPQNPTEYDGIKGEYAIIKPNSFHDYSNRTKPLDCLIVDRSATAYIDSSKGPIKVYAALGSKIYDIGGNATIIDIDSGRSYYESNSEYLGNPCSYYFKRILLGLGICTFGIIFMKEARRASQNS